MFHSFQRLSQSIRYVLARRYVFHANLTLGDLLVNVVIRYANVPLIRRYSILRTLGDSGFVINLNSNSAI